MARYLGPKCRYCRIEHQPLGLKGERCTTLKCPLRKQAGGAHTGLPGKDPKVRAKKPTDYGIQLREKQRLKRIYGMLEKQFHLTFEEAVRLPGKTGDNMIKLLERRLDSVIFRMGFARTRKEARQIVGHKHVLVNGACVNVPSYLINAGDVIEIREKSKGLQRYKDIAEVTNGRLVPEWMDVDQENFKGTIKELPSREAIDVPVDEMLIVELYSK